MKISSPFAICLKEANESHIRTPDLVRILQMLPSDAHKISFRDEPLDFIASQLHRLFVTQSASIRTCVLSICLAIETETQEYITEHYLFDKLIAISIDQRPQNPNSSTDEEKNIAFQYIKYILTTQKRLPLSIIRALISLNQIARSYQQLIIGIICEASLYDYTISSQPDVSMVIWESFSETPSTPLSCFITYGIENNIGISNEMESSILLNSLLHPSDRSKQTEAKNAIIEILRTWPGLLKIGIQQSLLANLIQSIPHESEAILSLLYSLIRVESESKTVLEAYSGFLLHSILEFGVISKLQNDQTPAAISFLSTIHRFETPQASQKLSIDVKPIPPPFKEETDDELDWESMLRNLTMIYPHKDVETTEPVCVKLISFFTTVKLNEPFPSVLISPVFNALIEFLISFDRGFEILDDQQFKKTLLLSFRNIINGELKDTRFACWEYFRTVLRMASITDGIRMLTKWNFIDLLTRMGQNISNSVVAELVLPLIQFHPTSQITVPIFARFLSSSNSDIRKAALNDLRLKARSTPFFEIVAFEQILIPHIEECDESQLSAPLNLLIELIRKHPKCHKVALNHPSINKVLREHARLSLPLLETENEVEWWMSSGIFEYVKVYDNATQIAFGRDAPLDPSIVPTKDDYLLPPHLFAIASSAILIPQFPRLFSLLSSPSITERRAAFFALGQFGSVNQHLKDVEEHRVIDKLFESTTESSSYLLFGTLMVCLTLFSESPYITDALTRHKWERFTFGAQSCVLPTDPSDILPRYQASPVKSAPSADSGSDMRTRILQLINPLNAKNAKASLVSLYRESPEDLLTRENALLAMDLLTKFVFPTESRTFLLGLFRNIPLFTADCSDLDEEVAARMRMIFTDPIILSKNDLDGVIHQELPQFESIDQVKRSRRCPKCPEVYLTESAFKEASGIEKKAFYQLSNEEQTDIRSRLLTI